MGNDLTGSRIRADRPAGRPPTPPPDARLEAAKTWSTTARNAAREAFETALAGGSTRDEAIEAGHEAGLRRDLEEKKLSRSSVDFVLAASKAFGSAKVAVLPPDRPRSPVEERCFELSFPDQGFPDLPPAKPAKPTRSTHDDENQKTTGKALAGELAKAPRPPRQGTLDLGGDRRTA